ncbi:molybdopterin-binding protein [Roseovarius sp. 2305UL8-3]|uniref:molybdopterin-binding protein n=1 Tax=Roseovarius conchicola TaxID=3121636 RepID=UPI0035274EB5
MKFGPVSVDDAEGAILAHSLNLPEGRMRKGAVLSAAQCAALAAAGVSQVTVAQLEEGDVHEDAAARQLAAASCKREARIQLSAPFTGRVNLIAQTPGVVCLDVAQIDAANAVDPMITVATVPPFHQIHSGGMIATIKVISYAVPGVAVMRATELLGEAIGLATPIYASASLIVTDIPGGPGRKGEEAIFNRLNGLGIELLETRLCAHDEAELAQEIGLAKGQIVLILTASATSDIRDTAPEALRQAGGQITRFGIPVDPGNLLFLGALGDRPVIGLPGSARSPVLHGADWVLSRVACGVPIEDADFAAMGVGGLLKEIPTRPQPRRGKPSV